MIFLKINIGGPQGQKSGRAAARPAQLASAAYHAYDAGIDS